MKYILSIHWLGSERYFLQFGIPTKNRVFTIKKSRAKTFGCKDEAELFISSLKEKAINEYNRLNSWKNNTKSANWNDSYTKKTERESRVLNSFIKSTIKIEPIKNIVFAFKSSKNGGLNNTKIIVAISGNDGTIQRTCSFCGLIIPNEFKYLILGKNGVMKMCGFCAVNITKYFNLEELNTYNEEYNAAKFTEQL